MRKRRALKRDLQKLHPSLKKYSLYVENVEQSLFLINLYFYKKMKNTKEIFTNNLKVEKLNFM